MVEVVRTLPTEGLFRALGEHAFEAHFGHQAPISSEYIRQELRSTRGSTPKRLLILRERRRTSSLKHSGDLIEEKPWE